MGVWAAVNEEIIADERLDDADKDRS